MATDKVQINIEKRLYDAIKKLAETKEGEFEGPEDYIEYVLREIVRQSEIARANEDKEVIEKRLRALGYE